jgi:hypothetical protein
VATGLSQMIMLFLFYYFTGFSIFLLNMDERGMSFHELETEALSRMGDIDLEDIPDVLIHILFSLALLGIILVWPAILPFRGPE